MTKQVFLIEELWTDYLENSPSDALGYKPIGVALSESEATRLVSEAGMVAKNCWAMSGPMPRLRYKPLPVIGSAVEPSE